MTINKETKSLSLPWEKEYGYAQSVKVGDTIYISGQVGHDETGKIVGRGDMEAQMRQTYINIQKTHTQYGATMVKCRKDVFSGIPVVASTIVRIQRLAFPELLIEIRCIARV